MQLGSATYVNRVKNKHKHVQVPTALNAAGESVDTNVWISLVYEPYI